MGRLTRVGIAILLSSLFLGTDAALAAEIAAWQAETAVAHWLAWSGAPLGASVGQKVLGSVTYADDAGVPLFHIVRVVEGGFVVTSADDTVEPIIAFSGNGGVLADESAPLLDVLRQDLSLRKSVRASKLPSRNVLSLGGASSSATAAWAALLDDGVALQSTGLSTISDVRVAPLVQSKWNQKTVGGVNTYNRFTPNNYACGCVATAGAQLMRYHEWPDASISVPQNTFYCTVGGVGTNLTLFGGTYAWQSMPLVPDSTTSDAQRDTISKLTCDLGVAVHMRYSSSSSDTQTPVLAATLTNLFGYASACVVSDYESGIDAQFPNAALANLDAGFPVAISIKGSSGGHAVVADGYGFSGSLLYVHLNMGWSGNDDVWYNLPVFDTTYYSFSIVRSIVFNVFPEETGEIISGRVTDADGSPLAGVTVSAQRMGGGVLLLPVESGAGGIYAVRVPSPMGSATDTWQIVACQGASASTQTVNVAASVSTHYTFSETAGTYSDPPGDGTVGNRWGVDFVFSDYPVITTDSLPSATIGVAYSAALAAVGGVPPYRWEISRGALPAGLTLNADGTIAGTPTVAGSYAIEFRVLNNGDDLHSTATLTLAVNGADSWTYDSAAGTLSHSSTPWVLNVTASGTQLTVQSVRTRATSFGTLPLGDPVGGGYTITAIADAASYGNGVFAGESVDSAGYFISGLTLPASLGSIGYCAFYECQNLASPVAIPDCVTTIRPYAFAHSGITSLTLGSRLAEIGDYAFYICPNLAGHLEIPDSVTTILANVFVKNTKLTSLTLGSGLRTVKWGVFAYCSGLTSVQVKPGVSMIGGAMFKYCSSLRSIILPSSVTSMETHAFENCSQLTNVTYEGGCPTLSLGAFGSYYSEVTVYTNANAVTSYVRWANRAQWQSEVFGDLLAGTAVWQGRPIRVIDMPVLALKVTFDPQGGTVPTPAATTHVTNGVPYGPLPSTTCAGHAFAGWWTAPSGGSRVTASAVVTATADHTLYAHWVEDAWAYDPDAGTLSHGTVPWVLTVDAVGTNLTVTGVFSQPSASAKLPLEDTVADGYRISAIGELAFALNTVATGNLVIPETVSVIGEGAFYGCRGFSGTLTLPDSITNIAWKAFFDCSGFVGSLKLPGHIREIPDGVFAGCSGFTGHLVVPDGVTNIEHEAFVSCDGLTSLYIPASVVQIQGLAFYVCERLRSVIYACDHSAFIAPYYFNLESVTSYVYAANAASWAPFVDDGPIESGHASWNGRPIRVLEACDVSTSGTPTPVPYAWLLTFKGLVANGDFEAAAGSDPDGDGMNTWAEYVAGSDPTNAASVFRATIDAERNIHWSPDLSDRLYAVEGKASLTDSEWRTPDAGCRFFRVRVELPKP